MPTIPDKSINMILTDLPYGTTKCKWDIQIPFEPLWNEYKRILFYLFFWTVWDGYSY